ncbi:MAG: aminotransferase class I/II-fold pyridoxal phosphate-dependent enzyme, partial [Candidatus Marinimicrobia bacterium]|nr:aminotransferase class I/II-fold pyridoxal phosphate-dependent enzyme [Candidatus Neomarinimicrobiota bacterium]
GWRIGYIAFNSSLQLDSIREHLPKLARVRISTNHPVQYAALESLRGPQEYISEFVSELKKHREVPQAQQLAPTIAEIKKTVCQIFDIKEEVLDQSKRGHINEPRNLAVYFSRKKSRLKLEEIAREFGLGSYSSVSSIVMRTEQLLSRNRDLRKKMKAINKNLIKGQAKTCPPPIRGG